VGRISLLKFGLTYVPRAREVPEPSNEGSSELTDRIRSCIQWATRTKMPGSENDFLTGRAGSLNAVPVSRGFFMAVSFKLELTALPAPAVDAIPSVSRWQILGSASAFS